MNSDQKIVAIGAASGIILMVISVYMLTQWLPPAHIVDTLANRLAYASKANVFAIVPLFIMLICVGNARFLSSAIDPTRHAEDKRMEVDGRVADNTFQQNFVFFVATLALSTLLPIAYIHIVWSLAIVFVTARFVFWAGYRLNPLYRAPGMSATAYMNLGVIVYTLYYTLF